MEAVNAIALEYGPLVNAVMMLATVAAVIVALYSVRQALVEKQVRLRYTCSLNSIMLPAADGETYSHHHMSVVANIANLGLVPSAVPYLGFGLLIRRNGTNALLNPQTDFRSTSPLPLPPGEVVSIELRSPEQLLEEIRSLRPKWFPRLRCGWFKLSFATKTQQVFFAEISKELRREMRKGLADLPWLYDSTGGASLEELWEARKSQSSCGSPAVNSRANVKRV